MHLSHKHNVLCPFEQAHLPPWRRNSHLRAKALTQKGIKFPGAKRSLQCFRKQDILILFSLVGLEFVGFFFFFGGWGQNLLSC